MQGPPSVPGCETLSFLQQVLLEDLFDARLLLLEAHVASGNHSTVISVCLGPALPTLTTSKLPEVPTPWPPSGPRPAAPPEPLGACSVWHRNPHRLAVTSPGASPHPYCLVRLRRTFPRTGHSPKSLFLSHPTPGHPFLTRLTQHAQNFHLGTFLSIPDLHALFNSLARRKYLCADGL